MKTQILAPIKLLNMSKALAAEGNVQPDLLYMRAVLVSTGQNKNDDVFLPDEMWAARNTPPLKPVNWEHESGREVDSDAPGLKTVVEHNQIIGCIYNCFVADKDGRVIDDKSITSDNIPSDYDIVIDSVIYKYLFPKTAARIVEGVNNDSLFVSMEAWFTSYDYLVGNKIVARNQETAFLDRHLRANGGDGVFSGERVGRVLRNIVFGGVGIVHRPANQDSVIQSLTNASHEVAVVEEPAEPTKVISKYTLGEIKKDHKSNDKTEAERVMAESNNTAPAPHVMSSEEVLGVMEKLVKAQHDLELKSKELEVAVAKNSELEKTIENLKSAFQKGAAALKDALGEESVAKLQDTVADEWFSTLASIIGDKLVSAKELSDKLAEATEKLMKIEAEKKLAERLAKIESELGLAASTEDTPEEAQAKVSQKEKLAKSVENLSDESFDSWLNDTKELLSVALNPFMKKKDEKKMEEEVEEDKKKERAAEAEMEVLENVTASETVPAGNTNNDSFDWNKAMSSLVSELFGNKEDK